MKTSIHQRIAIAWVLGAPFSFAPVIVASSKAQIGSIVAQGIVVVTIMIALCPYIASRGILRQWFCWTDALSPEQHQALADRDLSLYYKAAYSCGYVGRLTPYLFRLTALGFVTMAASMLFPHCVRPAFAENATVIAVIAFGPLYLVGVMVFALASTPIIRLIQERVVNR